MDRGLLIDLNLERKRALILGGGKEAELKAEKLADGGADIGVVALRFTKGLRAMAAEGKVELITMDPSRAGPLIERESPAVVFISTGRPRLDEALAKAGRSAKCLVCVVDTPALNDFNMPAIAKLGPVRVAISTGGRSPAMAKVLRQRIEQSIRPEDLLQVELQNSVRRQMHDAVGNPHDRKRLVYAIISDEEIARFLRDADLERAKARALQMIRRGARDRA